MAKKNFEVNGIDSLQSKLKKMQEKLKKYEGENKVTLPYSQEEWDNMTEIERNEVIEEAKNNLIEEIKKDVFN